MNIYLVAAIVSLALWVVLAFVVAWASGWAHLPLILAVLLLARAIVDGGRRRTDS